MTPIDPSDQTQARPAPTYSVAELAELADVSTRTVRYYISTGLLPGVGQVGPGARYGATHLARLRLIRRLQQDHLPLAEIRARLDQLEPEQIASLAESAPEPPTESALDYVRRVLHPDAPPTSAPHQMRSIRPPLPTSVAEPSWLARPSMAEGPSTPWVQYRAVSPAADLSLPTPDVLAAPYAAVAASVPTSPSPGDRSQWERIVISPDIELHVRRPLSRIVNRQVDRLLAVAQELFKGV